MKDCSLDRFDVYRVAKEALGEAVRHRAAFSRLPGELRPQMERALVSTVLNVAEGAGRRTRGDQRRHVGIARGSAVEAAACLDCAALLGADARAVDAVA